MCVWQWGGRQRVKGVQTSSVQGEGPSENRKEERKASSSVTLHKTLPLSESQFPHLEKGLNICCEDCWQGLNSSLGNIRHPGAVQWCWCVDVRRWCFQWAPTDREVGMLFFLCWPRRHKSLEDCFGTGACLV